MSLTPNPKWIAGIPPCTAFCQRSSGINGDTIDLVDYLQPKADGRRHSRYACNMCRRQKDAVNTLFADMQPVLVLRKNQRSNPVPTRLVLIVLGQMNVPPDSLHLVPMGNHVRQETDTILDKLIGYGSDA